MYCTLRNVGLVLIVFALCAVFVACGKGKKMSFGTSFSPASSNNPVTIIHEGGESEGGLRQTVEFDYDLEEYPSEDGFTVVPMETDRSASSMLRDKVSLAVKGSEENKAAELNVDGLENPTLHFCYDPDRWEVTGVSSTGLYGDGKYLFMAAIAKSGVLVIHAEPAGRDTHVSATGKVAEVQLAPKGTMRRTNEVADDPPGNVDSLTVAWFVYPPNPFFPQILTHIDGEVSFHIDGLPGIFSLPKDGILDSMERSTKVYDNVVHDVRLSDVYWEIKEGSEEPLWHRDISWTERLQGDYTNDGEVTVADLTPMAWLYGEGQGSPESYAQGAVVDGSSSFVKLKEMTRDIDEDGWLKNPQQLYSFYYNDVDGWTDPGWFVSNHSEYGDGYGLTDRDTALDGFMDGYVYPYQNLSEGYDELPNGFWTSPEYGIHQPGDIAPIEAHYLERIDGYRVWTIPSTMDIDPENPTYPWRSMSISAQGDYVKLLRTYDRAKEKNPGYFIFMYPERPWANESYDFYERLRKAEFSIVLSDEEPYNCFDPATEVDEETETTFDIIIEPFIFEDPLSRTVYSDMLFGPITRISNVHSIKVSPPPADKHGPQYFDGTPPDPDAASTGGVRNVTQEDQDTISVQYMDADDLDENGIRELDNTVTYKLFALVNPRAQMTPAEFFAEASVLKSWEEDSSDLDSTRTLQIGSREEPIPGNPLAVPGDTIWFGVRAKCYYNEYYVDGTGSPNENIYSLEVEDKTPPHFVAPDDFYSESRRDNAISFTSQVFRYNNAIRIIHNPAVDPPLYSESSIITYKLYLSSDREDLEYLGDDQPIAFHSFPFNDRTEIINGDKVTKLKFDVFAASYNLLPEVEYYYCITAEDQFGNVCQNDVIDEAMLRDIEDESIEIARYEHIDTAHLPGDMLANNGEVYLLYPNDTASVNKTLTFQKILQGSRIPQQWLPCEEIKQSNNEYLLVVPYTQARMCAQLTEQGEPMVDSSGVTCPMVSASNYRMNYIGMDEPRVSYRRIVNNTTEWINELPIGIVTPSTSIFNGNAIATLKVVISEQQSEIKQFLGWVYDVFLLDDTVGSLVYSYRTDERDQNGFYLPWTNPIDIEYSPSEYYRVPGAKGNDIITRTAHSIGATATPVPGQGGGQTYQDRLYMLVSGARVGNIGNAPWLVSKLFWTDDPAIWSVSNSVDLKDQLDWRGSPDETSFGPNAFDVVEQLDSRGERNVYVVYNGAGGDPFSGELGLRTEMARDTSDGPSGFYQAGNFHMIDDSYYYPYTNEKRLSFSQVDLRHKQSALYAEGISPYAGLGCAYIHPDSNVYLAETSETRWEPRALTPGPSGAIDQGEIIWVKLIYNYEDEEDVPYVLYVVKTDLAEDEDPPVYYLKLWTPDD